jgi:hypothetical protein
MKVKELEAELKGRNVQWVGKKLKADLEAMLKSALKGEQEKGSTITFESLEKKYAASNSAKPVESTKQTNVKGRRKPTKEFYIPG